MLTIDEHTITLTRGDTLALTIGMVKDGEPYELQTGDVLRFAISTGRKGDAGYKLHIAKDVPHDTLTVVISSDETEALTKKSYCYDVELTYADGFVDTFISDVIKMVGESE